MNTATKNIDRQCPLCGDANLCALDMGQSIEACWCNKAAISAASLHQIPVSQKNLHCLCQACAKKAGGLPLGR